MQRKIIKKLSRKKLKAFEGKLKNTSLTLPALFKKYAVLMKEKHGSLKGVLEFALRKYMSEHPTDELNKKSYKWIYSMPITTDIRDKIKERIPENFTNINQAYIIALAWYIGTLEE